MKIKFVFIIVLLFLLSCKVKREIYSDKSVISNPIYFTGILLNGDTIYYPKSNENNNVNIFFKYDGRYLTYKKGKCVRDIGILDNKYEGSCYRYDDKGKLISISNYHKNKLEGPFVSLKDDKVEFITEFKNHNRQRRIYYNADMTVQKEVFYKNDSLIDDR